MFFKMGTNLHWDLLKQVLILSKDLIIPKSWFLLRQY